MRAVFAIILIGIIVLSGLGALTILGYNLIVMIKNP